MTTNQLSPKPPIRPKPGVADCLIEATDRMLRTLAGGVVASRKLPGERFGNDALSETSKKLSIRLMRINHAGEAAAQGLYHGQVLTARTEDTVNLMKQTAHEESDHLAWCKQRLEQLGGRTSFLTPFWYLGALAIGAAAGIAGDRWSLGFVKETEDQVVKHLESHLARISRQDRATAAIIEQIKQDEAEHAQTAEHAGPTELPRTVKSLMRMASRVMTGTANYL